MVELTCTACSVVKGMITAEPQQVVLTEKNHVITTKVTKEVGIFRIFTIESIKCKDRAGISAVKIK